MSRVLNIKINHEGIVLDGVICEGGRSQFTDNEEQYGYRFWDDEPEETLMWLKKHLVDKIEKFDNVIIDVEGVKEKLVNISFNFRD